MLCYVLRKYPVKVLKISTFTCYNNKYCAENFYEKAVICF